MSFSTPTRFAARVKGPPAGHRHEVAIPKLLIHNLKPLPQRGNLFKLVYSAHKLLLRRNMGEHLERGLLHPNLAAKSFAHQVVQTRAHKHHIALQGALHSEHSLSVAFLALKKLPEAFTRLLRGEEAASEYHRGHALWSREKAASTSSLGTHGANPQG